MVKAILRRLYWLLAGGLIGFGFIGILSIGLPFLLLGVLLITFGAIRLGGAGLWAAVVGLGAFPAALLFWDVTSAPWACESTTGSIATQPNVNYYACVDTFAGPLTTYHIMGFGFSAIALAGLAWPLFYHFWRRFRRPAVG